MAPRRPPSHKSADKSVIRLHDAFVSAGWTVEDLDKDYGEDLLVRIFKDEQATPYTFYVQAKSTSNLSRYIRRNDKFISYPYFKVQHLEHWNDFWEPVILTVWDSQADVTYWEVAQNPERIPDMEHRRPKFFIPLSNVLDDVGVRRIAARTVRRHKRFDMEQQGAQVLVDRLQKAFDVRIEYNSQAGILIVDLPDGGSEVTFFGKMADRVDGVLRDTGASFSELLTHTQDHINDALDKSARGEDIVVRDRLGNETARWSNFADYWRHLTRHHELDEEP